MALVGRKGVTNRPDTGNGGPVGHVTGEICMRSLWQDWHEA